MLFAELDVFRSEYASLLAPLIDRIRGDIESRVKQGETRDNTLSEVRCRNEDVRVESR